MQIRLLGGVGATDTSGRAVDVGPAKSQALLAALALSPGSAVPVSRLIDLVWGDQPPRTADKTLQSYVTRLRKGLGTDAISRVGAAYRLDLPPESVDVTRFQRLLAIDDVDRALAEWTGVPLAGLDAAGFDAVVDGLVEQWLTAAEAQLEDRVERDPAGTIGTLTELTSTYPFREGLWALLMTGLYRVGRQADALAAYRSAREQLVEHLGVEPGPRLRELERLILGQDDQLGTHTPSRGTALGMPTGTVTFGFTDVADSTRLWARDRRAMADAIVRHDRIVAAVSGEHEGYVFATGGDSFGVVFHRASDAVRWAEELQASIESEPWPDDLRLRLRIGIHTGETEERGKGYFGSAVNVAGRILSAGHGGQTLVSGVTAALVEGADLHDLGTYRIDGVIAEQRVHQLGAGDFPPLQIEVARRGNLPRRLGRLIGRTDDVDAVTSAIAAHPIVTLVGPGGIGKTRLALAAAELAGAESPGGSWLIELAPVMSSADVARAVADALDVHESPSRPLVESILGALAARPTLIVLDNCEHVVDGAAALVESIAIRCPDVRVVATSREGLGVEGEQLVAVSPLDPGGSAVELFDERATAISPAFDAVASRADVVEICQRLDGVPLAIELAAARTRSMSPADLVERLDDRLRLLTGGRRTSVERHRTLRATIQWSYDLLSELEQALFRRLSIFAGPFDLAAAEIVAAGDDLDAADVDELLAGLVDRSMVIVESGPFGRRFQLLETIRQFGAELLSEVGRTDRTAGRHAEWCLGVVTDVRRLLAGPGEIEGVARLAEVWSNLRAAFEWACDTGDVQRARALLEPIVAEVYLRSQSEIGDWSERLLEITPTDDRDTIAFGMTWAARRYMRHLDQTGFDSLVARFGEPDDSMVRYARSFIAGDYPRMAEEALTVMRDLVRRSDDYVAALFDVLGVGGSLLMTGQLAEVDAHLTACADLHRQQGPPTCLHYSLTMLGFSALQQGREEAAWRYFDEAVSVDVPERTNSMSNPLSARRLFRAGRRQRAIELLSEYVADVVDLENIYNAQFAAAEYVNLMTALGRVDDARSVHDHLAATGAREIPFLQALLRDAEHELDPPVDGDGGTAVGRTGIGHDDERTIREVLLEMRATLDDVLRDGLDEPAAPSTS